MLTVDLKKKKRKVKQGVRNLLTLGRVPEGALCVSVSMFPGYGSMVSA